MARMRVTLSNSPSRMFGSPGGGFLGKFPKTIQERDGRKGISILARKEEKGRIRNVSFLS